MRTLAFVLAVALISTGCVTPSVQAPEAARTVAPPGAPVTLDFMVGEWTLHDASGAMIGHSTITGQEPGAILYERRAVGQTAAQPLWFENAERTGGWVQLFLNPSGQVREFATLSSAGEWPLVLGGDVTLRDGARAKFRLTVSRASNDEMRRLLEMSRDGGQSWASVLDYTYRRARR